MEKFFTYPVQAAELLRLLAEDQAEHKRESNLYFKDEKSAEYAARHAEFTKNTRRRAKRSLEILAEIKTPALSNIGAEAAQALSILASHSSLDDLKHVLETFTACYEHSRDDTYYQAIPAMTDWRSILEREPQSFGTIWLFDAQKRPYLPTVKNLEHINERRAEYGIEPLHWPTSLAIPEAEQPWLKGPLSEMVMRMPSDEEYEELAKDFLDT